MPDEFIHPNWHVIFIHFPLGLLGIGIIVELLSFMWRRSGFRIAGHWMILIGSLLCIPTATSGIYALRDTVVQHSLSTDDDVWNDTAAKSHWNATEWKLMTDHVRWASIGSVIVALAACTYLAASDRGRKRLYWPLLVVILFGMAMLSVASYHSGESIYTQGTAVELGRIPGRGGAKTADATGMHDRGGEQPSRPKRIEYFIPPLELHMVLAGLTIAIALGSFASMLRRWNRESDSPSPTQAELDRMISAEVPPSERNAFDPPARLRPRSLTPAIEYPAMFPSRYWLAAFFVGLLTAVGGLWVAGDFKLDTIRSLFTDAEMRAAHLRLLYHVVLGVALVILPLFLAAIANASRRMRLFAMFLTLILIAVAGAQVWMGVLLTFDSTQGPLTKFNPPQVITATAPATTQG